MTITSSQDYSLLVKQQSSSMVEDVWSRVSSNLFIIHMEDKNSTNPLTYGLNDALKNQVAKYAVEHENFKYNITWKMLYFLVQHPFTIIILGCSLIWIFGRVG